MERAKNDYGLIAKDDQKSWRWSQHFPVHSKMIVLSGSPILLLLKVIIIIIKERSLPKFMIFRYLNDYSSLMKTLLRFFSEFSSIAFFKLIRCNVFWICHNVDKETIEYHPRITGWRKKMLLNAVDVVFVTSELLVPYAYKFLKCNQRVLPISFGETKNTKILDKGDREREASVISKVNSLSNNSLTCIITGQPVAKTLHFEYVERLIYEFDKIGINLFVVIAGDFSQSNRILVDKFIENKNIIFFDEYTQFSDEFIKNNIDFYFRVYDDYSVPYSIFEASSLLKPILTMNRGILGEIVKNNNIGSVVDDEFIELEMATKQMLMIKNDQYEGFLIENNWGSLYLKIKDFYKV